MISALSNVHWQILTKLANAANSKKSHRTLRELQLKKAPSDSPVPAALAELVGRGLVGIAEKKTARSAERYYIKNEGRQALKSLPPPEGFDAAMTDYQHLALLLGLLGSPAQQSSAAKLGKKIGAAGLRSLGLGTTTTDDNFKPNGLLLSWHLDTLRTLGQISLAKAGRSSVYQLGPSGLQRLRTGQHYPALSISLTGAQLNELLTTTAESAPAAATAESAPAASTFAADTAVGAPAAPPSSPAALSEEQLLAEIGRLRQAEFAAFGMVKIARLRAVITQRFGSAVSGHDMLDPLLKSLRGQRRIQLVAEGDPGSLTPTELADAVREGPEIYTGIEEG